MLKSLLAAHVFLFAAAAGADDPPPAPKAVQPRVAPVQPGGLGAQLGGRVSPTVLARYEEEAEVLEAQLDVKKAYIKAAEVSMLGSKVKLDRVLKLEANKAITSEEVMLARFDVESAAAQLDIRKAEAKEVEVKLKHAKKRVEDGKAGLRPAPAPKLIDPRP